MEFKPFTQRRGEDDRRIQRRLMAIAVLGKHQTPDELFEDLGLNRMSSKPEVQSLYREMFQRLYVDNLSLNILSTRYNVNRTWVYQRKNMLERNLYIRLNDEYIAKRVNRLQVTPEVEQSLLGQTHLFINGGQAYEQFQSAISKLIA